MAAEHVQTIDLTNFSGRIFFLADLMDITCAVQLDSISYKARRRDNISLLEICLTMGRNP